MKRAFTLVELLIVVVIIGILATLAIPQYTKAIERAIGVEAYSGIMYLQVGEKIYYAKKQTYLTCGKPISTDCQNQLDIILTQRGWQFGIVADANDFVITATRVSGPCKNTSVTMDSKGNSTDIWQNCVGGL